MKHGASCPKCSCTAIRHVLEVADRYERSPSAHGAALLARVRQGKIGGHAAGALEAFVCSRCGYCELYVKDPESLVPDGVSVRQAAGG